MHGPVLAVVFNAVPGRTTRPRRVRRHLGRVAVRGSVSSLLGPGRVEPVPGAARPVPQARTARQTPTAAPAATPAWSTASRSADRSRSRIAAFIVSAWSTTASFLSALTSSKTVQAARPWTRRTTALALVLGLLAWLMAPPAFSFSALPWGVDQWGHLVRLELLRESVANDFSVSPWLPHWYAGQDLWQYYPPLVYFAFLPAALITGSALDGLTLSVGFSVALTAIGFLWAFRPWLGNAGAFVGALVFTLAPVSLAPFFGDGNIPWGLHHVLLPFNIGLLLRVLTAPKGWQLFLYGLTVALMILAHSMLALMTMMGTVPLVTALWFAGGTNVRSAVIAGAAAVAGAALASIWLLPAVTHADMAELPAMVGDKVVIWSGGPFLFDRSLSIETLNVKSIVPPRYLGFSIPLFALAGAALGLVNPRYRAISAGFAAMGVLTFIIGYGTHTPIWDYIPFHDSLMPNRIFNITVMPMSVFIGMLASSLLLAGRGRTIRIGQSTRRMNPLGVGVVLILFLVLMEYRPFLDARPPASFKGDEILPHLIATSGGNWEEGRYWDLTRINDSRQTYTVTFDADRFSVVGWANEGTLHLDDLVGVGRLLGAGRMDAIVRLAETFNTEVIWLEKANGPLVAAFRNAGYETAHETEFEVLLRSTDPSSYVKVLDRDVLAIGFDAGFLAGAIPSVAIGASARLQDYDDEFLDAFSTIVIAKPDFTEGGPLLRTWIDRRLERGQRVVVDLVTQGADAATGASSMEVPLLGEYTIQTADGEELILGPFGIGDQPFLTRLPLSSPQPVPTIAAGERDLPIYRWEKRGDGQLIALPFAFIAHVFGNSSDQGSLSLLTDTLQSSIPADSVKLPPVEMTTISDDSKGLVITFNKKEAGYVLLSLTYSPHWRATVNGEPRQLIRHENMMVLRADQGSNTITVDYVPTPIQWASAGISAAGLAALIVVSIFGARSNLTARPGRAIGAVELLYDGFSWIFGDPQTESEQETSAKHQETGVDPDSDQSGAADV